MSLAEYLELMFSTLTISQKDVKQKDVDTTPEEGFHSYISFCRALRYITLIFLFATVMTYFYDAFLGPILSQFDSEFELAASRNRSIRMAMTNLLPTAISRFGHVLFVAPIALLLIIANVVTWSTTFRLWSFRRFMRWKFFGSVWQAMTIQAIADQLQSGASLQNVLDSSKESHPISKLKKQSRILAKLSGDNDALLRWLQRFRWVEPSPLPASHVANPKMLATLFQRQASLLRQKFDNFWTLAARYVRVLGTLYIGAVALWLASEVVTLLVDVTYYAIP